MKEGRTEMAARGGELMSNDPSEIRAQIEQTRARLSDNRDALAYEGTRPTWHNAMSPS
jgi:Protein of unknown function (DUF3618)